MPMRSWNPVIKIFAYCSTNSQSTVHKSLQATLALGKHYSPTYLDDQPEFRLVFRKIDPFQGRLKKCYFFVYSMMSWSGTFDVAFSQ